MFWIRVVCLIALSFLNKALISQNTARDSLLLIANSGSHAEAALAFKELARRNTDTLENHEFYARKGLAIAEEIDDPVLQGNILMNLGVAHDIHGKMQRAIEIYDSCQVIFDQLKEDKDTWLSTLYINYGASYYYADLKSVSLDYWLKAYEHVEKNSSSGNYGAILNNISVIYEELGKYNEAIAFFGKSVDLKKKRGDDLSLGSTLLNLGELYSKVGRFEDALFSIEEARQIFMANDAAIEATNTNAYEAKIRLKMGQKVQAENIIQPFLKDTFAGTSLTRKVEYLKLAGDISILSKNFSTALKRYELCLSMMKQNGITNQMEGLLDSMAKVYYHLGQPLKAYELLDESKSLLEMSTTTNRIQQEQEMQVKFNTLEKERQNLMLAQENANQLVEIRRTRIRFWLAILALLSITGFAAQTYFNRRKVNRLNDNLQRQKTIIEKALREKEILLKEIHHRVKNNLQVVSSLLGIQSRQVKDKATVEAISKGRTRVQSMSLIHQNLYNKDNLTGVGVQRYFEELSQNLLQTYSLSNQDITLISDIDDLLLDVDTMVPLGLILNELITNALKYAFPDGAGEITVIIREKDQGLLLSVKDNGIGIDISQSDQDSFGFELIQAFIDKLDGDLEIISDNGTEIRAVFKSYKKAA